MLALLKGRIPIVAAVVLGQNAPTWADQAAADARVVVATPTLDGGFDDGAARQVVDHIRAGIGRSGPEAVAAGSSSACAEPACFARVTKGARATHLVRAVVKKADRDYQLRLELRDARGRTVATAEDTCEICGFEEAAEMLEASATRLTAALGSEGSRSTLEVASRPAGATILVDGQDAGTTPARLTLPPGKHRIELRKPGFAPSARTVELEAGVQTASEMRLVPAAAGADRRLIVAGWSLLGGGLLVLAGGISLLAIDGREYKKRCAGADVDADGDCRLVYRLKWPGAALTGAGAALAAVGVTLLVVGRHRGQASVRANVTPNGVRLSGRF